MNNGKMCTIVEFQHVKPGKGGAFVRTKLRDIKTGRVVDYTFNAGTKFDQVRLETKKMQYLYNDGADFYFMDNDTFEQIAIPSDVVGDNAQWLKENDEASLLYADDELISIEPQMFVELEITQTDPGFKGDTVQGGTKPATLETGAVIQVPMYMNQGDDRRRWTPATAASSSASNARERASLACRTAKAAARSRDYATVRSQPRLRSWPRSRSRSRSCVRKRALPVGRAGSGGD